MQRDDPPRYPGSERAGYITLNLGSVLSTLP